jgi:hypothetical protein
MAPYRIVHYDKDGILAEELMFDFAEDDEAIEHVGRIDTPHEICLWDGDRLVVRCPPWTAVVPSGTTPSTAPHASTADGAGSSSRPREEPSPGEDAARLLSRGQNL